MITLTKDGSAIKFTFDDSQHYLTGDGVIEVPVNSLALVTDESNMATFRKAASNDIFISALYSDFGMSKSELIAWYKNNMVSSGGGSGSGSSITSGDVENMISTALEDYPTNDDLDDALEDYYTTDEIDAAMSSLTEDISDKVDTSAFTASEQVTATALNDLNDRADTIEQVTAIALNDLNDNKQAKLVYYQEDTEGDGYATIDIQTDDGEGNTGEYWLNVGGGSCDLGAASYPDGGDSYNTQINIDSAGLTISSDSNDGEDSNIFEITPLDVTINGDAIATEPYVDAAVSGKADTSAVTAISDSLSGYVQTSVLTSAVTRDDYTGVPYGGAVYNAVSALSDSLTGYVQTSAITSSVTSASTDSEIPTAKAVFDAIPTGGTGGGSNVVEVTQAQYEALVSGGTVDPDALYIITDASEINISDYAKSSAVTAEIAAAVSGKADTSAVTQSLSSKQDTLVSGTNIKTINNESILGSGNITIQGGGGVSSGEVQTMINAAVSGKADTSAVTENEYVVSQAINALNVGKVDTSAITSAMTSGSTDSQVPSAKCVYDALGGLKFVQCTQAQYDSMVSGGTVDSSTVYFITGSNS